VTNGHRHEGIIGTFPLNDFDLISDFHLTQLLSGHECYGGYVHTRTFTFGKKETPACRHCPEVLDNALHTLTAYAECKRDEPEEVIGPLDLTTLVQKMVTNKAAWEAVA